MLGVISRARSVIDTITIDVRAGGTRLPGQSQSSGVGVLRKQSGNDQQRRGEPGTWEKPCKTMEVIVNTVMLSTDRACRGIRHAKKNPFSVRRDRLEINLSGRWPIFRSLKNPRSLNFTERKRLKGSSLLVALSTFSSAAERDRWGSVPASTCYLAIVPWFYLLARLIDMLRSRGHHQAKSFWVPRREVELDESYF